MGLFQKPTRTKRGIKVLIYGATGVGKTFFTLSFPRNAVIDTEDGSSHYVDNPNMAFRLVTTSATEVEDAIDEIKDSLINEVDTVTLDSETKMYENLQHAALVVVERRARQNGRDAFAEGLSQKEWGKLKLIHKRINAKLIELSGLGKNVIVVTQLSDEKQQIGDQFVKVGEKPNGIKGLEYDFDIVLKLCYDKETERRYGIIEKDRTSTYQIGQEVENPSFDDWRHIFDGSQKLEAAKINLTKDIEADAPGFNDEEEKTDLETLIVNIKAAMKDGLKAKKLNNPKIMEILGKYSLKSPDALTDIETAKKLLADLK